MTYKWQHIISIPNAVSMLRILMAPVMMVLAMLQMPALFLAAVMFSGITDVLDGYLARRLNQVTDFGSHLDSWGDFIVYSCMATGALLLWPEIVLQERLWFVVIVLSFTLPAIVGVIKFGAFTSYHTWSVKLAVFISFIAYLLLFTELSQWPFRLAAIMCAIAGIEEIIMTLLLKHEHADVRSAWAAWKLHRKNM